jgi:hypothetical protein
MRRFFLGALTLTFAGAAAAQETRTIAVEAIDGRRVNLRAADVELRADGGADVHGWARRARTQAGLINAHLHAEAFDAEGASLGVVDGGWNGVLSIRDRSAEPFHIRLSPELANAAVRVRVTVEPGARHDREPPLNQLSEPRHPEKRG